MTNSPTGPQSSAKNIDLAMPEEPEQLPRILEYTPRAAKTRLALIRIDRFQLFDLLLLENAHLGDMTGAIEEQTKLEYMSLVIEKYRFFYTFKNQHIVRVTLVKPVLDNDGDDDRTPPSGGGGIPSWMAKLFTTVIKVVIGKWVSDKIFHFNFKLAKRNRLIKSRNFEVLRSSFDMNNIKSIRFIAEPHGKNFKQCGVDQNDDLFLPLEQRFSPIPSENYKNIFVNFSCFKAHEDLNIKSSTFHECAHLNLIVISTCQNWLHP